MSTRIPPPVVWLTLLGGTLLLAGCSVTAGPEGLTYRLSLSPEQAQVLTQVAQAGLSQIPVVGPLISDMLPYLLGATGVGIYAAKKKGEEKGWDQAHAEIKKAATP